MKTLCLSTFGRNNDVSYEVEICLAINNSFDVISTLDDEILWWVEENITKGKWQAGYSFSDSTLKIVFIFVDNEDAMAFKLRWT